LSEDITNRGIRDVKLVSLIWMILQSAKQKWTAWLSFSSEVLAPRSKLLIVFKSSKRDSIKVAKVTIHMY
jgi:hypothetical protein